MHAMKEEVKYHLDKGNTPFSNLLAVIKSEVVIDL